MSGTRTTRYEDLGLMNDTDVHIIGVGAIGRQVAITLAIMGWTGEVHLYDFDTVEAVNLGTQGFGPSQIGQAKTEAVISSMIAAFPEVNVTPHEGRVTRTALRGMKGYVFACVDSMETRKMIFDNCSGSADLLLDARMASTVFTVHAVFDESSAALYDSELYTDDEAFQGGCTSKSTYFCANIAAGFMISQLTKHVRGIPLEADVRLDLVAMGMITNYAPATSAEIEGVLEVLEEAAS